ncbi:hypothetical protein H7F51_16160 [Novosphingobium flavum]|uniref:Uncharacterized protein n=1 Tax=Novosphingobium flavum TaxID=1778672 RepID=A0A7X1FU83_9SPHN|nr:hypothetical protein [Novosphingobium flavum]MBC2667053.1 hypothetical protein [Novosphingobium flavum]
MTGVPSMRLACLALVIALPLAGCKGSDNKQATASGEILPGSASDAMLPEDRLTSQPPLDPGAERGPRAKGEAKATDAADEAATDAAALAPAATAAAQ